MKAYVFIQKTAGRFYVWRVDNGARTFIFAGFTFPHAEGYAKRFKSYDPSRNKVD